MCIDMGIEKGHSHSDSSSVTTNSHLPDRSHISCPFSMPISMHMSAFLRSSPLQQPTSSVVVVGTNLQSASSPARNTHCDRPSHRSASSSYSAHFALDDAVSP